jgi:hypothetical protein
MTKSPNQRSRLTQKEHSTPLSSKKGVVLQEALASLKQNQAAGLISNLVKWSLKIGGHISEL